MFKIENDLLWVGSMIVLLFFIWLITGGPSRIQNGPFIKPPAPLDTGESYGDLSKPKVVSTTTQNLVNVSSPVNRINDDRANSSLSTTGSNQNQSTSDVRTSRYKGLVTLYSGSAFYEASANREYITIHGSSNIKEPINITGWTLKNSGSDRYYNVSGQTVRGQTSTVKIPRAVLIWEKNKNLTGANIIISANQDVQIVSGSFPPIGDYSVRDSFRVNKCTGYIANQSGGYNIFYPSLSYNCPRIESEPGADTLYTQCYDFVRSISTCKKPNFREDWCLANAAGEARWTAVCNLPSTCKTFVQKYASYEGCVANHRFDKDFLRPEWRVYLGSTWEIWAGRRETITLYDNYGQIVDQIKYQ